MEETEEQIRSHWRRHKNAYLAGAGGLAIGLVGGVVISKGVVININGIWKSPGAINHVTTELVRRGHPGYIVKCLETGEVFASQARAAAAHGVKASRMSQHLAGKLSDLNGMHFERLGEMV